MSLTRISKKLLNTFPKEVASEIKRLADDYGIKSLSYKHVPAPHKVYLGEGDRITLIRGDQVGSLEMVAEHNIGAANVSHRIGDSFNVPAGTTIITIHYYTKFWMDVVNVGFEAMPETPAVEALPAKIDSEAIQRAWKALAEVASLNALITPRPVGELNNYFAFATRLYAETPDQYSTEWLIICKIGTGEWAITNRNMRTTLAPAADFDEAAERLCNWVRSHQIA